MAENLASRLVDRSSRRAHRRKTHLSPQSRAGHPVLVPYSLSTFAGNVRNLASIGINSCPDDVDENWVPGQDHEAVLERSARRIDENVWVCGSPDDCNNSWQLGNHHKWRSLMGNWKAIGCLAVAFFVGGGLGVADQKVFTSEVYVDSPGCTLGGQEGKIQVTNHLDDLYLRFWVSGTFTNPNGETQSCGGSCSSSSCSCSIEARTELDVPPGTTRSKTCSLPVCTGCNPDCYNEAGDCQTANMYCVEESNISLRLKAYSCDGTTWVNYGVLEYAPSYSVNTACE